MGVKGTKWCSPENQCLHNENIKCEKHSGCERCSWNPVISSILKELRVLKAEINFDKRKNK